MLLTTSIIDEACERYFRKRDRYVTLAGRGLGMRASGAADRPAKNAVLSAQGRDYSLDPQDYLLALLLDIHSEQIVKSWPMQRRMPRRSVELAQLTLEIRAGKHRKMLQDAGLS